MKRLILLLLLLGTTSAALGKVSVRAYRADGITQLEYQDIMVGTKLTIIVDSNVAEEWYGGALGIEGTDTDRGVLYGRDYDGFEYPGSVLPAAGDFAAVWETVSYGTGFELYGGEEPDIGNWFIIDYNAIDIGDCNVVFYDLEVSDTEPNDILSFHHVRTRDFYKNTKVDFDDFALLALYWQETNCGDSNDCEGADLDINGKVDANDVTLFSDYWLESTE